MLKAILYLSDRVNRQAAVVDRLAATGLTVVEAAAVSEALRLLAARPVAFVLIDLAFERAPIAAIRMIRVQQPFVPVVALFDSANPLMAAEAIDAGAVDVLPWPFDVRDTVTLLTNTRDRMPVVTHDAATHDATAALIAQSPAMQRVAELIALAAHDRAAVCVSGESGSGRTLVGRTIHRRARMEGSPLIAVDCAPDPQTLERRLFGNVPPPRTISSAGAEPIGDDGALYQARGGTLLLRHVVDAPARVQGRLARLLRDREAVMMNARRTVVGLDIQPIATLDPDVDLALSEGRLRGDLYRQLAQVRIEMPPLRRRREDLPLLAVQMLARLCRARGIPALGLSRAALQVMAALPWKGNAAELGDLLEALIDSVPGPVIQIDALLEQTSLDVVAEPVDVGATLRDAKARFERDRISAVLMRHHGRVPEAAKELGIQRTNLYRKIRQLNVARSLLSAKR